MKSKKYCNESHEIKSIIINTITLTITYNIMYLRSSYCLTWLLCLEAL